MPAFFDGVKRLLVGKPFRTERLKRKPLPPKIALPIFSSSALSSLAYAPDEILLTLATAGVAATLLSPAVGLAVLAVLLVLVLSYRQSVAAYPSGGGDYEIVRANLGPRPG
ncbi:DNA-binding protein, partial [Glutamicibacter sp. BSL13]